MELTGYRGPRYMQNLKDDRRRTAKTKPGMPSRRARVISKAQLRAARRMDAYADKVSRKELTWEKSKKTRQWKLVKESVRLLKRLRRLRKVKSQPPTGQAIHPRNWKTFNTTHMIGE